ncbi:hypothetical protein [Aquimarina algiphila]|uniref:Uncharacterized protein n=1 Tax=Aquimarina algiphila TaxID=2047982 RepID=A0A554VPC8_9FLAO|nr:hypothetical protein [Aquimarina algiphila]TSE10336.1 hypothetical protein FOF46_04695 [Aquimarina algiphila]
MNDTKLKISRIVGQTLKPSERTTFRYVLEKHNKHMAGILATSGTQLTISFLNGSDVEINSFELLSADPVNVSPSRRILQWEDELTDCTILTGSIENIQSKSQYVSLYLITFNTQNP